MQRMTICRLVALAIAMGTALPGFAVELGSPRGVSALGQPLQARVDLLLAPGDDIAGLSVDIRPSLAFASDANLTRELAGIRAELVSRGGDAWVRLRSDTPVTSPVLAFRLRVSTRSEALTRTYELLLDPPPASVRPVRQARPAAAVPVQASGRATDPVRPGDTLWGIARPLAADAGLSTAEMVRQLHQLNPQAFVNGDIDRLRVGAVLRLPASAATTTPVDAGEGITPETTATAPAEATPAAPAISKADADLERARATLARARAFVEARQARLAAVESQLQALAESTPAATPPVKPGPVQALPAPAASAPDTAAVAGQQTGTASATAPVTTTATTPVDSGGLPWRWPLSVLLLALLLWAGISTTLRHRRARKHAAVHAIAEKARVAAVAAKADRADAFRNGRVEDLGELPPEAMAMFEQPGHVVEELEDDSLVEADINIAYGRYREAEDALTAVLDISPENYLARLKLAELYYTMRRADDFAELADALSAQRPVISDRDWQRFISMGKELGAGHALFTGLRPVARQGDGAA